MFRRTTHYMKTFSPEQVQAKNWVTAFNRASTLSRQSSSPDLQQWRDVAAVHCLALCVAVAVVKSAAAAAAVCITADNVQSALTIPSHF